MQSCELLLSLYHYDFKAPRSTSTSGPPCRSKFNLVGPRDYRSNIRKIIYAKSKDETKQVSLESYDRISKVRTDTDELYLSFMYFVRSYFHFNFIMFLHNSISY